MFKKFLLKFTNWVSFKNSFSNSIYYHMLSLHNPKTINLSKNHSKLIFLLCLPKKIRKIHSFLESHCRILYFTCLKSYGKNFMKFDYIDWKIIAFKAEMLVCYYKWLWLPFVEIIALWTLNLKIFMLKNSIEIYELIFLLKKKPKNLIFIL